jgi:bleomycin hydrolase
MKKNALFLLLITIVSFIILKDLPAKDSGTNIPYEKPGSLQLFNPVYHFPPVNQDTTNACWSFSTLSFIESELYRLKGSSVKLSVMFPVYYAFIEKGKYFVKTSGKSRFKAGDLFPTVLEIIQTYGMVPEKVYRGQAVYSATYNHQSLEEDIEDLKDEIILQNTWNEDDILAGLTQILDKHLGPPPASFDYSGESHTPVSFAAKYVNLPWDEYCMITSFSYAPFYQFINLDVPDNWRQLKKFYNVPLTEFYTGIKSALSTGYSLSIDGDIGEPGRIGPADVCFIPEYDIPGDNIDQRARDYRFNREITTDDHLMHVVGSTNIQGEDWFLVKDSWRDAFEGEFKGYFFYHADFARLKILAYLVHKDAIPEIAKKIEE